MFLLVLSEMQGRIDKGGLAIIFSTATYVTRFTNRVLYTELLIFRNTIVKYSIQSIFRMNRFAWVHFSTNTQGNSLYLLYTE